MPVLEKAGLQRAFLMSWFQTDVQIQNIPARTGVSIAGSGSGPLGVMSPFVISPRRIRGNLDVRGVHRTSPRSTEKNHGCVLPSRGPRERVSPFEVLVIDLDLAASLLLLATVLVIAVAYAIRYSLAGAARFDRVEQAGGSPLLGKGLMEMGYWALQPVATASERAGLNANTITGLSLGLGAAAGVALAFGHFGLAAAATVISSLGDVLDGLVARRTGTHSKSGAIFDAAADRYDEFFFLAGLACFYHDDIVKLGFVLLALLGSFMVSYGSAKAEALGVKAPRGAMRRAERAVYLGAGALLSPVVVVLAERYALPAWTTQAPMLAAVAIVGIVANVSAVRRLGAIMRAVAPEPEPHTGEPAQIAAPGDPLRVSRSHAG